MENIFFESWQSLFRSLIITTLAYLFLVVALRFSGKRTLSKMNAFDFIVTIALGSALATIALNKSIALADGILVCGLLILFQLLITFTSVRIKKIKKLVTNEPALLLYNGQVLNKVLKKERVATEELLMAARKKGLTDLKSIDAIVLETTGDFTVIPKFSNASTKAMEDVVHFPTKDVQTKQQKH